MKPVPSPVVPTVERAARDVALHAPSAELSPELPHLPPRADHIPPFPGLKISIPMSSLPLPGAAQAGSGRKARKGHWETTPGHPQPASG